MILYHGTNTEFEQIDLKKSKPNKDFGQGFYLSADYAQAMSMVDLPTLDLQKISQLTQFEGVLAVIFLYTT